MDAHQKPKAEEHLQHSAHKGDKENKKTASATRFSRRKLITSSLAASPILFSVKSPVAWAGNGLEGCSISTLASINASQIQNCATDKALSPGYWHSVIPPVSPPKEDIYYDILNARFNVFKSTTFHSIFLRPVILSNVLLPLDWELEAPADKKDNAMTFEAILAEGNDGKHAVLRLNLKYSNSNMIKINLKGPQFVRYLVAGYLNSLFYPNVIKDYMSTEALFSGFVAQLSSLMSNVVNSSTAFNTTVRVTVDESYKDSLKHWERDYS